ncbi:MAG: ABC transporter permease, partial [Dehalococcoidales bacterium]|nr:ABC transporter permease [Dehalococcoidales bacterium]
LIPTIILVTIIVFISIRLIPGDIIDLMVSTHDIGQTEVTRANLEKALGLDVPVYVQYGRWIGNIFTQGSLGNSLWKNTSVSEEIKSRIPATFELSIIAIIIGLLIAIPIGVYSAIRQDTVGDYISRTFAILGLAVPNFWLGTMVIIFPSIWWNWSPPVQMIEFTENPFGNIGMFLLPGFVLGLSLAATTMRMMRTMMLEVLRQDYIRTAWAKGLRERVVVMRHAMKNALIPVVTLIGLQLPILVGGVVIIEQIFSLPGMGMLMLDAINQRDYPIITGVALVLGVAVIVINLLVDLSYGFLDPRVQYK